MIERISSTSEDKIRKSHILFSQSEDRSARMLGLKIGLMWKDVVHVVDEVKRFVSYLIVLVLIGDFSAFFLNDKSKSLLWTCSDLEPGRYMVTTWSGP